MNCLFSRREEKTRKRKQEQNWKNKGINYCWTEKRKIKQERAEQIKRSSFWKKKRKRKQEKTLNKRTASKSKSSASNPD